MNGETSVNAEWNERFGEVCGFRIQAFVCV